MSTKTTTSTSQQYQYNPAAMSQYNSLQPTFGNTVQSEISDPYTNMFFNKQLGMGRQAIAQQQASANSALLQRSRALGFGSNSPLMAQQLLGLQRQGMSNQSNLYNNLLLQAGQFRQQALGMAGSYRPLQTGMTGTQTQSQSGLGTWLPQLVGAGIGAATMGMGGGMGGSLLGMAGAGSKFGATGASPQMNALLSNNLPQAPQYNLSSY